MTSAEGDKVRTTSSPTTAKRAAGNLRTVEVRALAGQPRRLLLPAASVPMDADPAILSDPWSGRPLGANPMRFMQRFTMFLRQQMAWYYLEIRRSIRLRRH